MHPDFVFFHQVNGVVRASIIDPHSHHLDDADVKLKALAVFSIQYGSYFHRIEALSAVDDQMRVLDMQLDDVRDAAQFRTLPPVELYKSDLARAYDS